MQQNELPLASYTAEVYRYSEDSIWKQYVHPIQVLTYKKEVKIIDPSDKRIISHFMIAGIQKLIILDDSFVKICDGSMQMENVIHFSCKTDFDSFCSLLENKQVIVVNKTGLADKDDYPDLNDPDVQEFVMKTLVSEEFNQFVVQIQRLISGFQDRSSRYK
jgi:hypothetical protein